jgi:hypothetical protein
MEHVEVEAREQIKERLLRLVRAGLAGSLVLASATLDLAGPAVAAPADRPSLAERAAGVRDRAALQAERTAPAAEDTRLAWGNWHNWRNGWPNGWGNWHNWRNWW